MAPSSQKLEPPENPERFSQRRPKMAVVVTLGHPGLTLGPLPDGAEFVLKPDIVGTLAPMLRRLTRRE